MKTYKLIKPIGDYPLVEYKQAKDKSYYNHHANGDATWIFSEIVENMPEYFVEVKEITFWEIISSLNKITKSIKTVINTLEKGTIQIKHCNCWCDNIGKL